MKHELPELNYSYFDLEPYIDSITMETHHSKHHQGYVNKLNTALEKIPELKKLDIEDLLKNPDKLPEGSRKAIINNGGGHYNHSIFWKVMGPKSKNEPEGILADKIIRNFGSFADFVSAFSDQANSLFGSGWVWLVVNGEGNLEILSTSNQDSPVSIGKQPILAIDVWEHAYYLKYKNLRADYVKNWWNVVNWETAEELFKNAES